jgi:hypothetical protein
MALKGELRDATRKVVQAQRDAGLAITFLRGARVIKQFPDGREEVLETLPPATYKFPANVPVFGRK